MNAKPMRTALEPRPAWPWRVALLTIALFLFALSMSDHVRAADPDPPALSAEQARYLEWYKQNSVPKVVASEAAGNQQPVALPINRFFDWYKNNGAPKPLSTLADAGASEKEQVARYQEWLKRQGAPTPIAAPAPQVVPVVWRVDVHPINDSAETSTGAREPLRIIPPPAPRALGADVVNATSAVLANVAPSAPPPLPPILVEATPKQAAPLMPFEAMLSQVGCSSCGTAGGTLAHGGYSASDLGPAPGDSGCNCGSGNCIPGRLHGCSPCEADTVVGRFLCGVYECICCPDPCYDPKWIPLADSAFFTDSARPQTQQRLGWDAGRNLTTPDRAEYFWRRADGKGSGPNPANHPNPGGFLGEKSVNYNDLSLYTEAALGNIGAFVEMPYRSLDGEVVGHAAGFADMNVGTKTLLFDCELLQISLLFRTYLPLGNASKGLGTGHVSLEPGVIVGVKLAPDAYFQGEVEEWIPIGGDPDYQGALLEYHMSVNQVLCRILPDVPLVATGELNGWTFQHGSYTDPFLGADQRASRGTYLSLGPGLRLFVCDKIDFGVGTAFAITDRHFADELFRSEFRWRY